MRRLVIAFLFIFLSLFVFVEIADARLVRAGGRGTISYQHETNYFFVENPNLVQLTSYMGMSETAYNNRQFGFGSTTRTIGGGGSGISAIPTNGFDESTNCNASYDFGETAPVDEPCEWRITEGDDFSAFGSFNLFFDNPLIEHKVVWTISDDNGVVREIDGLINTGSPLVSADGTIDTGDVMLNALWSEIDLAPGIYGLSVEAQVSSSSGQFFNETIRLGNGTQATEVTLEEVEENNPAHDEWVIAFQEWQENVLFPWEDDPNRVPPRPTFDIPEPSMTLVAYVMDNEDSGFQNPTNVLSFDSRFSLLQDFPPEILVIEAAQNSPPPKVVSTPNTYVFILMASIFGISRRRYNKN